MLKAVFSIILLLGSYGSAQDIKLTDIIINFVDCLNGVIQNGNVDPFIPRLNPLDITDATIQFPVVDSIGAIKGKLRLQKFKMDGLYLNLTHVKAEMKRVNREMKLVYDIGLEIPNLDIWTEYELYSLVAGTTVIGDGIFIQKATRPSFSIMNYPEMWIDLDLDSLNVQLTYLSIGGNDVTDKLQGFINAHINDLIDVVDYLLYLVYREDGSTGVRPYEGTSIGDILAVILKVCPIGLP